MRWQRGFGAHARIEAQVGLRHGNQSRPIHLGKGVVLWVVPLHGQTSGVPLPKDEEVHPLVVRVLALGEDPPPLGIRLDLLPLGSEKRGGGPAGAPLQAGGAADPREGKPEGGVGLLEGILGQGGRGDQGEGGQDGEADHDENSKDHFDYEAGLRPVQLEGIQYTQRVELWSVTHF